MLKDIPTAEISLEYLKYLGDKNIEHISWINMNIPRQTCGNNILKISLIILYAPTKFNIAIGNNPKIISPAVIEANTINSCIEISLIFSKLSLILPKNPL